MFTSANNPKLIQSTKTQLHSIRDQIRKHISRERTELKEMWLDLEMRTADAEEIPGDTWEKLEALCALRSAWLGLFSLWAREAYGMAPSGARASDSDAHIAV